MTYETNEQKEQFKELKQEATLRPVTQPSEEEIAHSKMMEDPERYNRMVTLQALKGCS